MKIKRLLKKYLNEFKKKQIVPIIVPVLEKELLKDKVALITGGSSGIGYAIAKTFADSGCKVIISGTNEEKLIEAKKRIKKNCYYMVMDVTDVNSISERIDYALNLTEEHRIDILVNSAGVHHTSNFDEMNESEFNKIMDTNVKGTFFISRAVGNYMKQNSIKGHILNISSSSALRPAWGPYQMSKWAVRGLTLGLAEKYQPYGIIVNALAPGQTATPMLGKSDCSDISNDYAIAGRYIMPEEVANLALFMVSDMGNMIVGDTYYMTGGSGVITFEH